MLEHLAYQWFSTYGTTQTGYGTTQTSYGTTLVECKGGSRYVEGAGDSLTWKQKSLNILNIFIESLKFRKTFMFISTCYFRVSPPWPLFSFPESPFPYVVFCSFEHVGKLVRRFSIFVFKISDSQIDKTYFCKICRYVL